MSVSPGQQLSHYRLVEKIGVEGRMSRRKLSHCLKRIVVNAKR